MDELYERKASHLEEDETLAARIRNSGAAACANTCWKAWAARPRMNGGQSRGSGVPELDELYERKASYLEEDEALEAQIQELRGGGPRQYLPESLGGRFPDERQALEGLEYPNWMNSASAWRPTWRKTRHWRPESGNLVTRPACANTCRRVSVACPLGKSVKLQKQGVSKSTLRWRLLKAEIRAMQEEQLAAAQARREEIHLEMEAM